MAKANNTRIGSRPKTGMTWIGTEYLRLPSGRVVKPKTRKVHCGTCFTESLLVKKRRLSNKYGYVCPDKSCVGHKRFDEFKSDVPWANQQGLRVAVRGWVRSWKASQRQAWANTVKTVKLVRLRQKAQVLKQTCR